MTWDEFVALGSELIANLGYDGKVEVASIHTGSWPRPADLVVEIGASGSLYVSASTPEERDSLWQWRRDGRDG